MREVDGRLQCLEWRLSAGSQECEATGKKSPRWLFLRVQGHLKATGFPRSSATLAGVEGQRPQALDLATSKGKWPRDEGILTWEVPKSVKRDRTQSQDMQVIPRGEQRKAIANECPKDQKESIVRAATASVQLHRVDSQSTNKSTHGQLRSAGIISVTHME